MIKFDTILLKDYIYYLLKILEITNNNVLEIEEVLLLYRYIYIDRLSRYTNHSNQLKAFLYKYRKIKKLLSSKKFLILYNKIYKIFFFLKNLESDIIFMYLNLSLNDLKKQRVLFYLPYNIEVNFFFKKPSLGSN